MACSFFSKEKHDLNDINKTTYNYPNKKNSGSWTCNHAWIDAVCPTGSKHLSLYCNLESLNNEKWESDLLIIQKLHDDCTLGSESGLAL